MNNSEQNLKKLSDKDLYTECKKWGTAALQARWRFAGLLPEVYRRRLYEKRGFTCIYEFAARLSGMSRDQVNKVLRLEKRFNDKPILKTALIEGNVSTNKLARIASIATQENQQDILAKTETLSKAALEIFVKENKMKNGLQPAENTPRSVPGHTLQLDHDVENQLLQLQKKGININEMLRKFLKERDEKINKEIQNMSDNASQPTKNRYINVKTRRILTQKFGTICAAPNCNKPAAHIHHEKPFAINHTHEPHYLKPLCKGHHELQHANEASVRKFRKTAWQSQLQTAP